MEESLKTLSKHFFDDEILYKSNGIIYLKEGVKRSPIMFDNKFDETELHANLINKARVFLDKVENAQKIREEENDYN